MLPESMYEYRPETPERKKIFDCWCCGEPIREGDSYYEFGSKEIHKDCIWNYEKIAEEE